MKAQIIQFLMQLNLTLIILCEFNNSYSNAHQSNYKIPMWIILRYYKYIQNKALIQNRHEIIMKQVWNNYAIFPGLQTVTVLAVGIYLKPQ